MRIYLAGPITGESRERIFQSFYRMEHILHKKGYEVYNPARLPEGLSWPTYMKLALDVLASGEIDAVVMLDGWYMSAGAGIEREIALRLDIYVAYENPMDRPGVHARKEKK